MKLAIVGSGISGLMAAYVLRTKHEVTLFEAAPRLGGHTNTFAVDTPEGPLPVDTGFIVFNERNYKGFVRLLSELGVDSQPSDMSFSVRSEATGLEYRGATLNGFFAQRRNLLSMSFHRMLRDILRFNRRSRLLLRESDERLTLGEYLESGRYSKLFIDGFVIPLGAAIWSLHPDDMFEFPAVTFARFFAHHGFLDAVGRPQWRVVKGGSQSYVRKLAEQLGDRIRLATPVTSITRHADRVTVHTRHDELDFDRVILASHSDQSLALLNDPSDDEKQILSAIRYQPNDAVLHTDTRLLPREKRAWGSWNYFIPKTPRSRAMLTYNMNQLQSLSASETYCVSLNSDQMIDPARVIQRIRYHHPLFTRQAIAAQKRHSEIDGVRRTHFCGAYWGYGFHEDGLQSALRVTKKLGVSWP